METMQALRSRRSCRSFAKREVEREKVETIVAAGKLAPNAGPLHLAVVRDGDYLRRIEDAALDAMEASGNAFLQERAALPGYRPLYGAPVLVMISAPTGGYSEVNAACAATAITIAATDFGLGSCYVVTPNLALGARAPLARNLAQPEGFVPMCGVLLGYPGDNAFAVPRCDSISVHWL